MIPDGACRGCGREVTLVDGHFCGFCNSALARVFNDVDVDVLPDRVTDVDVVEIGATDEEDPGATFELTFAESVDDDNAGSRGGAA